MFIKLAKSKTLQYLKQELKLWKKNQGDEFQELRLQIHSTRGKSYEFLSTIKVIMFEAFAKYWTNHVHVICKLKNIRIKDYKVQVFNKLMRSIPLKITKGTVPND